MALPLFDPDPTSGRRAPAVARITSATSVAEARAHLRLVGEPLAVVYVHARPAGLVSEAALDGAVTAGRADSPVGALMDYVAVPVDRRADADVTVQTFTNTAREWLRRRRDQ
jgi:hypothetical protein